MDFVFVPRALHDQVSILELQLAGDLEARHEYEIHLGSGACARGGRHICIVPKSFEEGDKIWLPFEGDRTLSIIISKALLLAADDKITDPVIQGQL